MAVLRVDSFTFGALTIFRDRLEIPAWAGRVRYTRPAPVIGE
jgi:hypothetical protein